MAKPPEHNPQTTITETQSGQLEFVATFKATLDGQVASAHLYHPAGDIPGWASGAEDLLKQREDAIRMCKDFFLADQARARGISEGREVEEIEEAEEVPEEALEALMRERFPTIPYHVDDFNENTELQKQLLSEGESEKMDWGFVESLEDEGFDTRAIDLLYWYAASLAQNFLFQAIRDDEPNSYWADTAGLGVGSSDHEQFRAQAGEFELSVPLFLSGDFSPKLLARLNNAEIDTERTDLVYLGAQATVSAEADD